MDRLNYKKIRVVVIDSGVNTSHRLINENKLSGISIQREDDKVCINKNYTDIIGHGTAICGILSKHEYINEIFMLRIYNNKLETDIETLLFALNYVKNNIECDIINMSLGVKYYNNELEKTCMEITNKGIIIVSAFDNGGAMSFPAAFDCVVGVDTTYECRKVEEFIYVESSPVNILAKGGYHRVAWVNPEIIINQGSSFSCAYITSIIAKILSKGITAYCDVINMLKQLSKKTYRTQKNNTCHTF